jgi:hypothetical protein
MKRDFELVVKILKHFEEREEISIVPELKISGYNDGVVAYHVRRMFEGGLLDAETVTSSSTETRLINVLPFGLTWEGHEFLDSVRQKSVIEKIKGRLGGGIVDVPFAVIKGLALAFVKDQAGL